MAEIDRSLAETPVNGGEPSAPRIAVNPALARLLGAQDPDDLGPDPWRLVSHETRAELARLAARAVSGEDPTGVITIRRVDGRKLTIRVRLAAGGDPDDPILFTATEVTETEELRHQLNLLSLLPESNPHMVFVLDGIREIAYLNPAARRWLVRHDLSAIDALNRLNPAWPSAEMRIVDFADGRRYSVQVTPVVGTDRRMVTVADITDETRLRVERDLFELAFHTTTNPMVITDAEGRIEHVNEAFSKYYGYSAEEARGKNPSILNPGRDAYRDLGVSGEEYDALFAEMWRSLARDGRFEADIANQCVRGTIHWMRAILTKINLGDDLPPKYLGMHIDVDETRRREEASRLEVLRMVARVGELRDNETGHHMRRVGLFARRLAETLGMPAKFCVDIQNHAPLHDIGKVGIGDEILLAPRKLSREEFEVMQRHATFGYSILVDAQSMEMAADIALGHHEKFDGSGYPFGVMGDAIPISARIAAVADVYDALRSDRPYKVAWDHESAREEILTGSGGHFCPAVVDAFARIESDFRDISAMYAD